MTSHAHTKAPKKHAQKTKKKAPNERDSLPYLQLEEDIKKILLKTFNEGKIIPEALGVLCEDLGRADTVAELKTLITINSRSYNFLEDLVKQ